ncbi:hypothetical protein WN51_03495 [Melipona quadrifasciata]|uniref:Uncharacterized protein n=1 Tax=Melipona quadrifasciata TaxID=166423 RepID=A0A0N0BE18_9HYME|nr:hypothetical protein WN51_03495 [Melipona quadrifasciata]
MSLECLITLRGLLAIAAKQEGGRKRARDKNRKRNRKRVRIGEGRDPPKEGNRTLREHAAPDFKRSRQDSHKITRDIVNLQKSSKKNYKLITLAVFESNRIELLCRNFRLLHRKIESLMIALLHDALIKLNLKVSIILVILMIKKSTCSHDRELQTLTNYLEFRNTDRLIHLCLNKSHVSHGDNTLVGTAGAARSTSPSPTRRFQAQRPVFIRKS